ncbi:hypothetical protein KBZ10_22960 [Streptomyces sp. F63]|uniref:hypothetical protein n=1 Tax=Streptomyces sp. F63 TaxID=2824887 RepID=UPI001B383BB1|nr:hypothetical protein [Streptomyces sp. F63]MBQ0987326.1 hypothetical protein [Streptomyces sp. F63]
MSARRPLLTASAAGAVLLALWFVPSANATVEEGRAPAAGQVESRAQSQISAEEADPAAGSDPAAGEAVTDADELALADTGSVDTTPYLLGGTLFLGLGAALVSSAGRRSRTVA